MQCEGHCHYLSQRLGREHEECARCPVLQACVGAVGGRLVDREEHWQLAKSGEGRVRGEGKRALEGGVALANTMVVASGTLAAVGMLRLHLMMAKSPRVKTRDDGKVTHQGVADNKGQGVARTCASAWSTGMT